MRESLFSYHLGAHARHTENQVLDTYANIIIKDIVNIFSSICKNMLILLMGWRYRQRCNWNFALNIISAMVPLWSLDVSQFHPADTFPAAITPPKAYKGWSQYPQWNLIIKSHDLLSDGICIYGCRINFEIRQVSQQQCCWDTCQISNWYRYSNTQCLILTASWFDKMRRFVGYRNYPQATHCPV